MKNIEHITQKACVKWFKMRYPNQIIFAIPNGGKRSKSEATRLKNEGVLAGVPDLFIAHANSLFNGLFVEMKKQEQKIEGDKLVTIKGKLAKNQRDIIEKLELKKYKCEVCYNGEEFVNAVRQYFSIK